MAEYLNTSIEKGKLDAADVMLFNDSLEAANATPAELIKLAQIMGAELEEAITVDLAPEELTSYHADRLSRISRSSKKSAPGLADSLITLVRRKSDGRLTIDKLQFVEKLAASLVAELEGALPDGLDAVAQRRPIVRFLLDRLIGALNRPRPAGASF
jgi:hypothetical protein